MKRTLPYLCVLVLSYSFYSYTAEHVNVASKHNVCNPNRVTTWPESIELILSEPSEENIFISPYIRILEAIMIPISTIVTAATRSHEKVLNKGL